MGTTMTRERHTPVRTRRWPSRSASGAAATAIGIVLLVIAIVALARSGLGDLTAPAVAVGPFVRTPLFGLVELALGVIALATAADRDVHGASTLAILTGVAGLVWLIEPAAFAGVLGVTVATGWLYVAVAAVLLTGVALDSRRQPVE